MAFPVADDVGDAPLATRWRLLALLACVYALHLMDRQLVSIVLEPLRHEFKLKDTQLGILSGLAYSAATVVAGVPAGMLADRYARKKVLIFALVLWSGVTATCGAATSYATLLLARTGLGFAEAGGPPAALSMMADAFPARSRGKAAGYFYAAGGVGTIVSFTAGAAITATWGWRATFACAALPGLALAIVLALRLREPPRRVASAGAPAGPPGGRVSAELVLVVAGIALLATGPSAVGAWGASLLIREHGLDIRAAGLILAASAGVLTPIGQLVGGNLAGRLARRRPGSEMFLAAFASTIGAVVVAACFASTSLPLAVGGVAFGMLVMSVFVGPSYGLLMTLAPQRARATALATASTLGNLAGYGGGPLLVGYLSDRVGGRWALSTALPIAMVLPLIGAALVFSLARRLTSAAASRRMALD